MTNTVVQSLSLDKCTGCEVCASVCPKVAISMKPDALGFLFPQIKESLCVNCGLCVQKCPVLSPRRIPDTVERYCIAGYARDEEMVQRSSSGGFFGVLAECFLQDGGIVAGVAWQSDFRGTEHILCKNIESLKKIQCSKYVQSRKGTIYQDVLELLKRGETVLFTGCPCEVSAMENLCPTSLRKHLYLVDLVCQGPTAPNSMAAFSDYLEMKNKCKITDINMRYAIGPWIPQYIKVRFDNGKEFLDRLYDTPIGDSIRILQRSSCYQCGFAGDNRSADLTLGDYHGANANASYYHESGVSIGIIHTEKGKQLADMLQSDAVYSEQADYHELVVHNPRMEEPWPPKAEYKVFREKMEENGLFVASSTILSLKQKFLRKLPVGIRVKIVALKNELTKG